MKYLRNILAAVVMSAVLSVGSVYANGGILITDITETNDPCVETDKGFIKESSDFIGILINGFTGILINGATDTSDPSETCGILIND